MANPASRFRRLPPPRLPARVEAPQQLGLGTDADSIAAPGPDEVEPAREPADLFEHFGVALRPPLPAPAPIIAAAPCPDCGWWLRADDLDQPCPVCARPHTPAAEPPTS